jgi:hypothetical protein
VGFSADKALKILGSGLLVLAGPQLFEGMFSEWVKTLRIIDVEEWVIHDQNLWDNIEPGWQANLVRYGPRMGKIGEMLTVEWAIKTTVPKNPALASLFLNWPDAQEWLGRNLEDLKLHVLKKNVPEEIGA